jgi:hypothetical protein
MVYQDKYGTVREIKKGGCFLACICNAYILQIGHRFFNQLDLNEIYYASLDAKDIEQDCYINSAYDICVKHLDWSIADYKKVDKNYKVSPNEIAIALMRRSDPKSELAEADGYVYHFVLLRRDGSIIDPIENGSRTAKEGEIHTMRIIILTEDSIV